MQSILHTQISECPPDIHELLTDLRLIKDTDFGDDPNATLQNWLSEYFFPGSQKKFQAIKKNHVVVSRFLIQPAGQIADLGIHALYEELRQLLRTSPETDAKKPLYIFLNDQMRSICKKLKPSKKPLRPTPW